MKRTLSAGLATGLLMFGMTGLAIADDINLSSWSEYTYDLSGGQTAGNWDLSGGNTAVTQTINADPSVYLNNLNQTSYQMDGQWKVTTASDDDFMGFVFGYQDDSHFYVMDWKQSYQNAGGGYGTANEGFRILKINADSVTDLDIGDFWESGTTESTILESNLGSGKGWADNTLYDFHLGFDPGTFSILVSKNGTTLWDVTVTDNTYQSGQFGFYNYSQASVQYAGFEQTGGVIVDPVPEPATMILFGTGLVGLVGFRLRKKKK